MQDTVSDADPEQELLILPAAYSQGYAHIRVLQAAPPETEPEDLEPAILQAPERDANAPPGQPAEQGNGNGVE